MVKEFWVKLSRWDDAAVTAALESSAGTLWIPGAGSEAAARLASSRLVEEPGEATFDLIEIQSARDVDVAIGAAQSGRTVVVVCRDWRIIPWENLVGHGRVLALVTNKEEAGEALEALELGLSGVVLESDDIAEIVAVGGTVQRRGTSLSLVTARVTGVRPVGSGDRACVDVAGLFQPLEGLLVGDRSSMLFLVGAETSANPFVAPRPFRVNAGGVHAYVAVPGGATAYLSELAGGGIVLGVDPQGRGRSMVVGRVKIEHRPLIQITAEVEGKIGSLLLQHAETVCLVTPSGSLVSVTALEPGNELLVHCTEQARHLGRSVEAWVLER